MKALNKHTAPSLVNAHGLLSMPSSMLSAGASLAASTAQHSAPRSPLLAAFLSFIMALVLWLWIDQGILAAWHAQAQGIISIEAAWGISACMLLICLGHAWLFRRAYRDWVR
jgi:Zn-dependent protease with chaperone function